MSPIQNRFTELLEAKKRQDRRNWTYRDIEEATGITPATLSRYATQAHLAYDVGTLAKLCEFLGCEVGDILVMVDDASA